MTTHDVTENSRRGALTALSLAALVAVVLLAITIRSEVGPGLLAAATPTPEAVLKQQCIEGAAVGSGNDGLASDCAVLLAVQDTLRGAETLNWSADTAIANWEGITISGSPGRVTELHIDAGNKDRESGPEILPPGTIPTDAAHGVVGAAQGAQGAPARGAAGDATAGSAWTATVTCDTGPGPVALTAPTEQEAIKAANWVVQAPGGCGGAGTYTTSPPAAGALPSSASDSLWAVTVTCDAEREPFRFKAPTRQEAVAAANWLIGVPEGCGGAGTYTTSPPAASGE